MGVILPPSDWTRRTSIQTLARTVGWQTAELRSAFVKRLSALAVALLAACSSSPASVGDAGRDSGAPNGSDAGCHPDSGDATIDEWLCAHDAVRASAQPAPVPPLAPLGWDSTVAATASSWAAGCMFSHNTGSGYGENIAASGAALAPTDVVALWGAEAASYDYATNSCSASTCGHYTQLVWRSTTSIGCALQQCSTGSPFGGGSWWFAVCDYSPPGNFVGQRPY
jgi:pathogenesis-related protein 1